MACKTKIPQGTDTQTTGITEENVSPQKTELLQQLNQAVANLQAAPKRDDDRYNYPEACEVIDQILTNVNELDTFPQGRTQVAHAIRYATEYIFNSGRDFFLPNGLDADQIVTLSPQVKCELLPFYMALEYGLNVADDYVPSDKVQKDPILATCMEAISASQFEGETVAYNLLTSVEHHAHNLDAIYIKTLQQFTKTGKADQKLIDYFTSEPESTVKVHPENIPYIVTYLQRVSPVSPNFLHYVDEVSEALSKYPDQKLAEFLAKFQENPTEATQKFLI